MNRTNMGMSGSIADISRIYITDSDYLHHFLTGCSRKNHYRIEYKGLDLAADYWASANRANRYASRGCIVLFGRDFLQIREKACHLPAASSLTE